ncbi:MAG: hypothetical protein M5U28_42625 [Sandaracinaceae bacterium]|nr:hypothetical protein [Sandaracinaceae bacterium]
MAGLFLIQPGMVFAGDFRIVRPLAEGGMGAVYVAEQLSTGQLRALKVMQPKLLPDEKSRERFLKEARIGSRVESEHVVQVLAAGVDHETQIPWLAMELLEGRISITWCANGARSRRRRLSTSWSRSVTRSSTRMRRASSTAT